MSQVYIGIYTALLGALTQWLGVPIVEGNLETTIKVLLTVGGALWAMWNRKRMGGVTALGFRSKEPA